VPGKMDQKKMERKKKLSAAVKGRKKSFPDLNKDGKITKADILMGRGVKPAGKTDKS